jgi:hypothetical protein
MTSIFTPFPNFRYYRRDNESNEFGIVIVKATYERASSGQRLAAEGQAPMLLHCSVLAIVIRF